MSSSQATISQVTSGIPGLDELLRGGYVYGRMYLISGGPGTGKTTLGMHFLETGLANEETVLVVHGEESPEEIQANAAQFNINLDEASFLDLGPDSDFFTDDPSYNLVDPSEIEEKRHTQQIHDAIREIDPSRIVIDPITQLRYIERSDYHYRKRMLSFLRFLKGRGITVLATATEGPASGNHTEIRSVSDGVIELSRVDGGRRVEVQKNRGIGQVDGDHGLEIRSNGIEVFPKVVPETAESSFDPRQITSGISELDALVGGGFEQGTVTFISGPPGVGKTTLSTLFLANAAGESGRSVIYLFEERMATFLHRCRSIGIPVKQLRDEDVLAVRVIEPQTLSSEEFAHHVRNEVEEHGAETILIDGLGGYASSIKGHQEALEDELHRLTRYLINREASVFVTDAIHQITGLSSATSRQISPIADNLMFLSYVELHGSLRKVVGVLKKRAGSFEYTLREFEITADGIRVGEPMSQYQGLLQGVPTGSDRNS